MVRRRLICVEGLRFAAWVDDGGDSTSRFQLGHQSEAREVGRLAKVAGGERVGLIGDCRLRVIYLDHEREGWK